jgi:RNase P/RNase MRP subunit p29
MKFCEGTISGNLENKVWNIEGSLKVYLWHKKKKSLMEHSIKVDGNYILRKPKKKVKTKGYS